MQTNPRTLRIAASAAAFVLAVVGATVFARNQDKPSSIAPDDEGAAQEDEQAGSVPVNPPAVTGNATGSMGELPAGHPPIRGGGATAGAGMHGGGSFVGGGPAPEAAVDFVVPARWQKVPNPNAMRIATYDVPKVAGDVEDGQIAITRAGGDPEANITRWVDQFQADHRGTPKRAQRTVNGLKVSTLEVEGTYTGMGQQEAEEGWAMLGAVIETPGTSHFFKLTGPAKTVKAARAEFEALVASVHPKATAP